MIVMELMEALELLPPDAEVFVDNTTDARKITRVEDSSQGVYIVVDDMATAREEW